MARITKRLVDSLRPRKSGSANDPELDASEAVAKIPELPPKKDIVAWDDELRGFGVRFKPSGAGAYIIQYRNAEGRSKRLTLGSVAELTPEEARKLARAKLSSVAQGGDPAEEKYTARTAPTVAEVCDWYLEKAESGELLGRRRRPIAKKTLTSRSQQDRHTCPPAARRPQGQ